MKRTLLLTINFYQIFISSLIKNILGINKMCRHSPTCSEYARQAIQRDGVFRGFCKTMARILSCQPFLAR